MTSPQPAAPDLPEAVVDTGRRVSLVWLIPLVTLLAAIWLGYHTYKQRGPLVTILFQTAEGLEAGRTPVRFKDVEIGVVENITLSSDLTRVRVQARLTSDIASYLNDRTRFWVVRPRLSGGSVSGLETLVGGTYIAADLVAGGDYTLRFDGLEVPPIVAASAPGRGFRLEAERLESIRVGSPLLYRGIEVGQVVGFELKERHGVDLQVFVKAPHDALVNADTRFWNVSGIDLSLDAQGVSVDATSLASMLFGGIAFGNPDGPVDNATVGEDTVFTLYPDEEAAFAEQFARREVWELDFVGSVRGLLPGAPVEFRGIRIGEVLDMRLVLGEDRRSTQVPVRISVEPGRMGLAAAGEGHDRALWDDLVENGLRAQLRTGSLLSGALFVDLDFYPLDDPRKIAWDAEVPRLPTVPTTLDTLLGLLDEIGRLPLDQMMADFGDSLDAMRETLRSTNALLERVDRETATELTQTLEQTRETLVVLERFLKPNSPLQLEAQRALREFGSAARSLRVMADYLERHPEALLRGKEFE
jgi:paraquat-inducible protein B